MSSGLRLRLRTADKSGGGGIIGPGGGGGEPIPASYFGMHIGRQAVTSVWNDGWPRDPSYVETPWPEIDFGMLRFWDGDGTTWRNIQRSRTDFRWTELDRQIQRCLDKNVVPLYNLGHAGDWATTIPGQLTLAGNQNVQFLGYNPHPPADMEDWKVWCRAVATRYKGKIKFYEIWNETNDYHYLNGNVGSGYAGSIATLVDLERIASQEIKAIDPDAKILCPNFVGEDGIVSKNGVDLALDTYLAAGGCQWSDCISIHGYNTLAPWRWPEGVVEHGARIKQVLKRYGMENKPIHNTEWGYGRWVGADGSNNTHPVAMPEQFGADFVTRMTLLGWCAGFATFCFYGFDAVRSYATIVMATADAPGVLLKPAYAYKFIRNLLVGGYVSGYQVMVDAQGKAYYKVNITTAQGQIGRAYWTPEFTTATVDTTNASSILDNLGNPVTKAATLTITRSPQFVFF